MMTLSKAIYKLQAFFRLKPTTLTKHKRQYCRPGSWSGKGGRHIRRKRERGKKRKGKGGKEEERKEEKEEGRKTGRVKEKKRGNKRRKGLGDRKK
jgi:hypothetical protein